MALLFSLNKLIEHFPVTISFTVTEQLGKVVVVGGCIQAIAETVRNF